MEERPIAESLLLTRVVIVVDRPVDEEDTEQRASTLHPMINACSNESLRHRRCHLLGTLINEVVSRRVKSPQCCNAGGSSDRVSRQRAGLIDRTFRRQMGHDVCASAKPSRR